MQIDTETPDSPFTILRIKRKRTEEPLDALVIESRVRRKKSRGAGVFQFAKTVENDVWQDEKSAKDVQEQVSRLARESSNSTEVKSPIAEVMHSPRKKDDSRRYTILNDNDTDVENQSRRFPGLPPKIISSKGLSPKNMNSDFKMFDAILEAEKQISTTLDPEMDKFLPLLEDYLKLSDVNIQPALGSLGEVPTSVLNPDDYVWDVFYHRPVTLSEWNEAAKIGTLSGLPPSVTNPYDSASEDEEEEDEADEDSNAEEYYKNDYPDEEDPSSDSDSDGFHESSDHDDMMRYDEGGNDYGWR